LRVGNLAITSRAGVHSGDDVVLTAAGPGAEVFHGHIDNTMVFRAVALALGLGK
jgi:alkaline phosphatase